MATTNFIHCFESKLEAQNVQLDVLTGKFNLLPWFERVFVLDRGLLLPVGRLLRIVPQVVTARPFALRPVAHETSWQGGRCFVLCVVALVLYLTFVGPAGAQPADSVQLAHFQRVRTITLTDPDAVHPDSLLMTGVWGLDVAPDGRMLVGDMRGSQALLFDPDGKLLALLDPSLCHPGFEVRPVHAVFVGDQSIFLSNAGPWGYRFTPEGRCLGSVDPDYSLVSKRGFLDVDAQGNLIGIYSYPDKQVLRYMSSSGKTLHEIDLPSSDYPKAARRIAMGGLIVDEEHIFYAGAVEPHVLKMTRDGAIVARISHRSSWFRDISRDLPDRNPSDPVGFSKASGNLWASATLTVSIFELTDQALMVQYRNGTRGSGYQVFTKDGLLVAEELGVRYHRFEYGRDGLVYRVVQPKLDETGQLPNPYLEVYRFVAP